MAKQSEWIPNGADGPESVDSDYIVQMHVGDNILADTKDAIVAKCKRTVSQGDGWGIWNTGAGWAATDVKIAGRGEHWYTR